MVPFYFIFHLAGVSLYLGVCKYLFLEINAGHNGTLTFQGTYTTWEAQIWYGVSLYGVLKTLCGDFENFPFFGDFRVVKVWFWAFWAKDQQK